MQPDQAPVGSRWWVFGHHWEVVDQIQHDGEPAVKLRGITTKRKVRGKPIELPMITRLLERNGTRLEA